MLTNEHEVNPTNADEPSTAKKSGQVVIIERHEEVTEMQRLAYNRFWQLVISRTTESGRKA